jgi:hypothetical protein
MKKLLYIKKFNEASGEECDFETFKEIMMDLSDYFECSFHDYTKEGDYFYDCELTIPQISDEEVDEEGTYLTAKYLTEAIPPTDDPGNIESIYNPLNHAVDYQLENLERLKNNIDSIIINNNKIKKIFRILQEEIVHRFQSFSNFDACTVGFDGDVIRICFDLPKFEGEE